jgi:hypothetical protein
MDLMHRSRQTVTATPWETAMHQTERNEQGKLRFLRLKNKIRNPEAYARAREFNEAHGISTRNVLVDVKTKFIRKHQTGFKPAKSRRPITLPPTRGWT